MFLKSSHCLGRNVVTAFLLLLLLFFSIFPTVTTRMEVHSFLYMFCRVIMPLDHVLRDGVKSSPEEIVGADTFELGRNGGHRDQRA